MNNKSVGNKDEQVQEKQSKAKSELEQEPSPKTDSDSQPKKGDEKQKPTKPKRNPELRIDNIADPKDVVLHPALDWSKNKLMFGVVFKNGDRAVLSSGKGLVPLQSLGPICERDGHFQSLVTPRVAQEFIDFLIE